ncbi:MAG: alkaline phosphatase D family protein [Chitinophagaceae bacterium]
MKKNYFLVLLYFIPLISFAQSNSSIVSGPLLGHVELRTANVWIQFKPGIFSAVLQLREKGSTNIKTILTKLDGGEFNTTTFKISSLEPGKTYQYAIKKNATSPALAEGEFATQSLWQWRGDAPDFNFITGSCAYFNEPVYDRPGKPYGLDSSIFQTMGKEKSAFMLWLGDNWYTREADFYSEWGLRYRASRDRSLLILQPLFKNMAHYAIWDDHDYGPDNANKGYDLKRASRNAFTQYWANPNYGMNEEGIYSTYTWNDVDFFLLDDRWFRSSDMLADSIDGKPNPSKKMYGDEQLEWLKNALLLSMNNSNISFRIIVTGSQVLNPMAPSDCFRHFPAEYGELMKFIADRKINGVLFITGDRHHSEIIKTDRSGGYPLFDITVSPLTSGVSRTRGAEMTNPDRIGKEIDEQNYARFSFTGKVKERKLSVEFFGLHGEKLGSWSVGLKDVSYDK